MRVHRFSRAGYVISKWESQFAFPVGSSLLQSHTSAPPAPTRTHPAPLPAALSAAPGVSAHTAGGIPKATQAHLAIRLQQTDLPTLPGYPGPKNRFLSQALPISWCASAATPGVFTLLFADSLTSMRCNTTRETYVYAIKNKGEQHLGQPIPHNTAGTLLQWISSRKSSRKLQDQESVSL